MAFTSEQEIELWERWSRGEPSRLIARALRTGPAAVRGFLARHGGVRPPERHRSDRHLTALEREEISRGIAVGSSNRAIAAVIGRSASTVSREITRNGGRDRYRATSADEPAWSRARRPKPSRLETNGELLAVVREQLELDWSPQQIARWLRTTRPDDEAMRVSHETIYRSIYVSSRTELGQHSARRLRSGRSVRHARRAKQSHGRGVLRNMTSIRDRPAIVMDRIEVGHWEGDLVMGKRPSAVATLVERATRFVRVVPLHDGYKADAVRKAVAAEFNQIPASLRRSLTWDRGREMAEHQQLASELGISVYFCDPHSPWQRGSHENTNRLLRQYLSKGADLRQFSLRDLDDIADRINARPRRVLGWATAAERFLPHLHAGGWKNTESDTSALPR
ncbi:IS30 family transposase [Microbacterium sp. ANT_H45B]|uniref:IS30 family transposase n=1 Tax=Microbacterium sp. ANT_H45B TaxID=2597346 RepID=UPI001CAA8291|nr:IS30 family transposase [Microbacterium sp. ANT_H45B]